MSQTNTDNAVAGNSKNVEQHFTSGHQADEAQESGTIEFPEFSKKEARLNSFKGWPVDKAQTPEQLADAGFFYNGEDDKTVCYYCGGGLKDWKDEDDPWQQHEFWFGKCDYVRIKNKNKNV